MYDVAVGKMNFANAAAASFDLQHSVGSGNAFERDQISQHHVSNRPEPGIRRDGKFFDKLPELSEIERFLDEVNASHATSCDREFPRGSATDRKQPRGGMNQAQPFDELHHAALRRIEIDRDQFRTIFSDSLLGFGDRRYDVALVVGREPSQRRAYRDNQRVVIFDEQEMAR